MQLHRVGTFEPFKICFALQRSTKNLKAQSWVLRPLPSVSVKMCRLAVLQHFPKQSPNRFSQRQLPEWKIGPLRFTRDCHNNTEKLKEFNHTTSWLDFEDIAETLQALFGVIKYQLRLIGLNILKFHTVTRGVIVYWKDDVWSLPDSPGIMPNFQQYVLYLNKSYGKKV